MPTSDASCPIALSVVLPAYNERSRILRYLTEIYRYLSARDASFEVLVVDDGSNDGTAALVERFSREHLSNVRLIKLGQNQGKGTAVRAGMRQAQGALQLFTDADGATPIQEIERLKAAIAGGADLAIGSRTLASRDPQYSVDARWYRTLLGSLFNLIVRQAGIRGVADTQCGFKLFRKPVAQDLFGVASLNGYGFDLELLYVARQRGYRIAEVPINWTDQPGSKVRVVRDGIRMLRELLEVRRNDAQGRYTPSASLRELSEVGLDEASSPTN